jgi:replicative DNA helicase
LNEKRRNFVENKEVYLASLPVIYDSLAEDLRKLEGGPEIQLRTLPTLSRKIHGLYRKRLYVIGGRTSQGKTSLAMQMALDCAKQGFRTFMLSFEIDEREMMLRMLANMCEADANIIRFNFKKYESKTSQLKQYFIDKKFPLLLTYNIGMTMDDLHELIADLPKPDIVIVDYVQAIRKIDLDKLSTMNNYIVGFRTLAVQNNFVGVMVSQINRAAMDSNEKKPHLWHLKGSGTIEEHADLVMLCHWDYFYTSDEKNKHNYRIYIAKNRQGNTGYVDVNYIPESYLFKDIGDGTYVTPKEVKEIATSTRLQTALDVFQGRLYNDDTGLCYGPEEGQEG